MASDEIVVGVIRSSDKISGISPVLVLLEKPWRKIDAF